MLAEHKTSRLSALAWGLAVAGFAIAFSWDLITFKRVFLHPDYYTYYYSFRLWFSQALAAGRFPLWNPSWGLGHPAEAWGTIPLDLFTPLELLLGPRYNVFQGVQAVAVTLSAYLVLVFLRVPRAISAGIGVLFFLSPWTNYFFYYFNHPPSFVAYAFLFYFLYRWLATDQPRYLFYIGWTTFLSMFGTKLELWFDQSAILALLAAAGPWLIAPGPWRVGVRRAAAAVAALLAGIAAQAWQLDILLPLMADSARELPHGVFAILGREVWPSLAGSVRDSAFLQLATPGLLAVVALRQRGPKALALAFAGAAILAVALALPTPYGGASRDGGVRALLLNFAQSAVLIGGVIAAATQAILLRDRDWRGILTATAGYVVFVYYFCRTGRGDLAEIEVLASSPAVFRLAMGGLVWFGCRRLAVDPVCRLALASIVVVFLMRDQGQVLLAAIVGWQWIPTREGYIVEFGFAVLAARGALGLAVPRARGAPSLTAWIGPAAALGAAVATVVSLSGNLYRVHPLVGSAPPEYPYFAGAPALVRLLDDIRTLPTARFYLANDSLMEFPHIMGTTLVAGLQQVTMYESLTDRRYREWTIFRTFGIRPEAKWAAYTNELTPGTMARLPRLNTLGYSNNAIYTATLISRPPPRRDVLELLGVKHVLRLYPGPGSYRVSETAPVSRDSVIDTLDPVSLRAVLSEAPTARPMFVAELDPLPRAFLIAPPSRAVFDELSETLEARAVNGEVRTPLRSLPLTAANIVEYAAERVVVETSAAADAVLVLSDLYHRFWEARVDGRPADIFPMFHVMRGVMVPAGRHRIEFICRVPGLFAAASVTVSIVLASLIVFAFCARCRKRSEQIRETV